MASDGRLLTLPNAVTIVRILCAPIFLWLLFVRQDRIGAAAVLGALGASDWVDGYLARHLHQVSTVGKVLDPVADRVLLGVAVVAVLVDGSVPAWIAWLTVIREVAVSIGMLALAVMGARRLDVQWVGKAGTFALMWAFPLFLASHADHASWARPLGFLAWCAALSGLVLSWYAAFAYIPRARVALDEGRVGANVDHANELS